MRKSKVCLLLFLLFSVFVSASCSCFDSKDEENKIEFSIIANPSTYYLGDGYITLNIAQGSSFDVDLKYVNDIEYFIVGDNNVEAEIISKGYYAMFKANKIGSVKVQAKYKDVLSTNVLEIACDVKNEEISESIERAFLNTLAFGSSYYIGIDYDMDVEVLGSDGIIEINEENRLEVVGIGEGTITIKRGSDVLYEGNYSVKRDENSLVVLNNLLENNHINSLEDNVVNSKFALVEEVDLSNTTNNYVHFLKYFTNLKKLNISNHDLLTTDIKWINNLTKLEELYLDDTYVVNSSFENIDSLSNLKILSLKGNKKVSNIEFVSNYTNLKSLDVSFTSVSDISPVSELNELETINLKGTKVTSLEPLKEKSKLVNLNVSNIDVSFDEVSKLNNFHNFKSIEVDGFSDVDISVLSSVTTLERLSMSNCDLVSKDLSGLNNLSNLRYLDISFNGYDDNNFNLPLIAENMIYFKTLRIGGNKFTSVPIATGIIDLVNVLDLSHSYYLVDMSNITEYWNAGEIILDYCNNLDFGEDNLAIMDMIYETICTKLSIVGSLMSFSNEQLEYIKSREFFSARIVDDKYHYYTDRESLLKGYYNSLLDYVSTLEMNLDGQYIVEQIDGVRDIVLDLTENDEEISEYYTFYVPKNIDSITIYGRDTYNLKISFVTRGEVSLYLADVSSTGEDNFLVGNNVNIISMYASSIVHGARGEVTSSKSVNGFTAIKGNDIYLTAHGDATLSIMGGKGDRGVTGGSGDYKASDPIKRGGDGSDGGIGIDCSSLIIDSPNITVRGGSGGYGGQGGLGMMGTMFSKHKYGGNGGNGGNGGVGVLYRISLINDKNAVIEGGTAGGGGLAGTGQPTSYSGEAGKAGNDGLSSKEI